MTTNEAIKAVEAANARFYRALSKADLPAMEAVWSHADDVACLHPGWPLLRGWDDVRASWQRIFQNQGAFRLWPSDVQVFVQGDVAWVLCTENADASEEGSPLGVIVEMQATNIFRREGGAWRMVHHHASQRAQQPLAGRGGFGTILSQN